MKPARADAANRLEHRGPRRRSARHPLHERARRERRAGRGALAVEHLVERLQRQLPALEPRPGAVGAGADDDPIHGARGNAQLLLVGSDRVQGGPDDDSAEVEEDGAVAHGGRSLPSPVTSRQRGVAERLDRYLKHNGVPEGDAASQASTSARHSS